MMNSREPGQWGVWNPNQEVPSRQFGKGFRDEFLKERILLKVWIPVVVRLASAHGR